MALSTRSLFVTLLTFFHTIQLIRCFPLGSENSELTLQQPKAELRPNQNALQYIFDYTKPLIQIDSTTGEVYSLKLKSIHTKAQTKPVSASPSSGPATKFQEYSTTSTSTSDHHKIDPSPPSPINPGIPGIILEDSITTTTTIKPLAETQDEAPSQTIGNSDNTIGPRSDLSGIVRLPPFAPEIWDSFSPADAPRAPLSILEQYRNNFGI